MITEVETMDISEVVTGQPIELVPHVGACVVDISLYVADVTTPP